MAGTELALRRTPWPVRWYEAFSSMLASAPARTFTRGLATALLVARSILPWRLLQRGVLAFVKMEAECCRSTGPYFKFLHRYLDQFEQAGTFERMRTFLREQSLSRAAIQLDAWTRIGLLSSLRHEVLSSFRGAPGVPPRLLTEAQLALSPGCDLTCEGCYTNEDRGGSAPRKERMAFLVDELVSCGAFTIHVIGKGEPFLSPVWANELLDVIEARPHVFFTIATHGMHIDDTLAKRLGRIGNVLVLISVDGTEALHDARRGKGSYQRVHAAMERLKKHNAVFGFSCMVSAKNYQALTDENYLQERAASGCSVGIYSRYFPLTSSSVDSLTMSSAMLRSYRERFETVRTAFGMPLLDLDEVEQHTGCHSRAGESVYLDGITGRLAPCVRVPFAPDDCRIEDNTPGQLARLLSHPFFEAYRAKASSCPTWCGANLAGELAAVGTLLEEHDTTSDRLHAYEERSRGKRHLPILSTGDAP